MLSNLTSLRRGRKLRRLRRNSLDENRRAVYARQRSVWLSRQAAVQFRGFFGKYFDRPCALGEYKTGPHPCKPHVRDVFMGRMRAAHPSIIPSLFPWRYISSSATSFNSFLFVGKRTSSSRISNAPDTYPGVF